MHAKKVRKETEGKVRKEHKEKERTN